MPAIVAVALGAAIVAFSVTVPETASLEPVASDVSVTFVAVPAIVVSAPAALISAVATVASFSTVSFVLAPVTSTLATVPTIVVLALASVTEILPSIVPSSLTGSAVATATVDALASSVSFTVPPDLTVTPEPWDFVAT